MPLFIYFFLSTPPLACFCSVCCPLSIYLCSLLCMYVSVQELEKFKTFVKRKPAFDVVVDGLNVANINKDKSKLSETVRKHLNRRMCKQ